jgi:hypothetical protein
MVPDPPAAYPVRASTGKWTDIRSLVVPEVWETQFAPPFVVFRMVPTIPTAYPVNVSTGK